MAANDYQPVSFNGEALTTAKLNRLANNTQFLFERTPRIRYVANGIPRDASLKVIAGKTPIVSQPDKSWLELETYFGSYFTAGCKPVVTATFEAIAGWHRFGLSLRPLGPYTTFGEVDHRGFKAHIWNDQDDQWNGTFNGGGILNWIAVGW